MQKSEIRKAYFLNKFTIITPGRARRPRELAETSVTQDSGECVLCPDHVEPELMIKEYGKSGKSWKMAVIKNKYPSVCPDNPKAYGYQEVLIETPDHDRSLADLPRKNIELYLGIFADRLKILSRDKKIDYILEFKNSGSKAGATLKHSHSQIFATAILPQDIKEELRLAEEYKALKKTCPYCDILGKELKSARRIWEDTFVGAYTPYASEYRYEAWIFTKRHTDNVSTLIPQEVKSLSVCLKHIIGKVNNLGLSYNFFLHQAVSRQDQHFYIKIQPRDINVWGGVELGSGLIINSVTPEKAAQYYRQ
jgi:UDPglucose--hexose-1-phosphate uridylyltransferase